jgi:glycosyltransferase 2 family protein
MSPSAGNGDEGRMDLRARLLTWRTLVSVVLGAALLVLLFRVLLDVDAAAMLDVLAGANPLLLVAAFVAYYLTFPLRAWRWQYLLRRGGIEVRLRDAAEIFSLSWYVNCLAPARLGDVYRAYLLRTHEGAPLPKTVGTLLIERVADILGVFVIAVTAGLWSFRGRVSPEAEPLLLAGIGIAIVVVALVVALRLARGWIARRLPSGAKSVWHGVQEGSAAAFSVRDVATVATVTAGIWLLEGVRLFLVVLALGLPDVGIGFSTAVFVALIGSLFSILPLTPAGVGFVEAGIVYALTLYGVPTDSAAAAALADRSITLISVLVFGTILYALSRKAGRAIVNGAR